MKTILVQPPKLAIKDWQLGSQLVATDFSLLARPRQRDLTPSLATTQEGDTHIDVSDRLRERD